MALQKLQQSIELCPKISHITFRQTSMEITIIAAMHAFYKVHSNWRMRVLMPSKNAHAIKSSCNMCESCDL